ncbi:hypothetical protein NA56DRAFT_583179 [Hyaloscypha hepaticicola]|uniref:Uncharacterized protein n=1 Tax=Hyaloscypha hepaticicola TaxID=2082293 RepID=A0A2J6PL71_9HELO|nr:hypothetical protein NA56DRAFT_583179 [Hyaloscypha hepaticicola]
MDKTRIILSISSSIKVLISKYNKRDYRDIRVKYISVIIIEYINNNNRYLNPIIIWPANIY